jgi:hypothetical protein
MELAIRRHPRGGNVEGIIRFNITLKQSFAAEKMPRTLVRSKCDARPGGIKDAILASGEYD